MKSNILILLLCLISFSIYGQGNECIVLHEELKGKYEGDCKKGKAHGIGKAEGQDIYQGSFKRGWPDGKGTYTWRNGKEYIGEFIRGKMDGRGVLHDFVRGEEKTTEGYWRKNEYIGEKNIPLYQISDRQSLEDIKLSRNNSNGSTINIRMIRDGSINSSVSNVFVTNGSGSARAINGEVVIDDAKFPIEIMVKFTARSRLNTITMNCRTTFVINMQGDWTVRLEH
jgi:hypothetical protein